MQAAGIYSPFGFHDAHAVEHHSEVHQSVAVGGEGMDLLLLLLWFGSVLVLPAVWCGSVGRLKYSSWDWDGTGHRRATPTFSFLRC